MEEAKKAQEQEKMKARAASIRDRAKGAVMDMLGAASGGKFEPISTGIPSLDKALCGGFTRQSVVCLGAGPGMGKTALASQIFESMAAAGQDVLYFNLEMSRDAMNARALARWMHKDTAAAYKPTVLDILHYYELDKDSDREKILAINKAATEYADKIAQHLWYNPGEIETSDLDEILTTIRTVAEAAKLEGKAPPFVCIDYLQLLTGTDKEDNIAVIKRAMLELKRYANENSAVVVIITANNRTSMQKGESGLNDGRDTSNIEYGADYHLGLEYSAIFASKYKLKDSEQNLGGGDKAPTKAITKVSEGKTLTPEMIAALKRIYNNPKEAREEADKKYTDDQIRQMIEMEYEGKPWEQVAIRINKDRWNGDGRTAKLHFNGATTMFEEIKDTTPTTPPPVKVKSITDARKR